MGIKKRRNDWVYAVFLTAPIGIFMLLFFQREMDFVSQNNLAGFMIPLEYTSTILSANGIIVGFWAAIIGLSRKDHEVMWRAVNAIEVFFFTSLGLIIFTVFLFSFQAIGIVPSWLVFPMAVLSFYIAVVCLGMTLHYAAFK